AVRLRLLGGRGDAGDGSLDDGDAAVGADEAQVAHARLEGRGRYRDADAVAGFDGHAAGGRERDAAAARVDELGDDGDAAELDARALAVDVLEEVGAVDHEALGVDGQLAGGDARDG